jgi:thiol:disulfide interchange protein
VGLLESAAVVGAVGLLAVGLGADRSPVPGDTTDPATLPASLTSRRVRWTDFGAGLEQARVAGKPVLATFVTSWCPYCKKMRGDTWRSPAVTARLQETVPVRVDVEDPSQGGPELAERYRISGYPVQILLDPAGGEIARSDGYQTPGQFLGWLDDALDRYRSRKPPTTRKVQPR